MSTLLSSIVFAAEPASILYIVTGALGLAIAGLRKSRSTAKPSSIPMLFCSRDSRDTLKDLNLL
jgi:hypothetical protein